MGRNSNPFPIDLVVVFDDSSGAKIYFMNTIKIRIKDNLNPLQEAAEIAKRLQQKALTNGGTNKEVLRIGQEYNIKELTTNIIVERYSSEKPIQMATCNACGHEYQSDFSWSYWHNYGGKPTQRHVCSEGCRNTVLEFLGIRGAKTRSGLKHFLTR